MLTARSKDALETLERQAPDRVRSVAGDVSDCSIAEEVTKLAVADFGGVDSLVINHAVLAPVDRIKDAKVDEWKKAFDVNLFSAIAFVRLRTAYPLSAGDDSHRSRRHCLP